ncbi:MAG: thiamine-phosphate kinase [Lautropia sp.]
MTDAGKGEFDLIRRHFAARRTADARVLLGIGDDCALLAAPEAGQVLAVSSDMLVEGRHFFAGTDPASVGHKTLAVNLSDLAAMGAEPLGFTLSIALPVVDDDWLRAFCDGLFALAARARCPLVGGDTTRGPLCLSVTVFGQVPAAQAFRRSGARVGDDLWVSGPLGGAALAVARRAAGSPVPADAARCLDWPEPRLALARALRGLAKAAIDISDGLAGDLTHVLVASGCSGARIERARVPLAPALGGAAPVAPSHAEAPADAGASAGPAPDADDAIRFALDGGDDYELLFAADPADRETVAALRPEGTPAPVRIGTVSGDLGILLVGSDGATRRWQPNGFDHFR